MTEIEVKARIKNIAACKSAIQQLGAKIAGEALFWIVYTGERRTWTTKR